MSLPEIVTRAEWRAAREELLEKEKAVTRALDALRAERRRLPMVPVGREYVFEGGDGKATLPDLFQGRQQLVVHHFVFDPGRATGCRCCSAFLDQIGHLAHLHARRTTFAAVSRAPFTRILPFKARMGWTVPWYSSGPGDFDADFGVLTEEDGRTVQRPGVSCFLREGDRVFHTYSAYGRGLEGLGSTTSLLDLTALGRQEPWEEPRGRAHAVGAPVAQEHLRYHDEYDD
ncbi:DUF899 domain-containing protein [Streptomyces cellulosae]|uniref:DUF899 family protein n=1 Tax=unclassified Streptomyces TaxID=2593676 RepID=UPI00037AF84E|nr:DUF899 domain-containing protein [Streptomyces sp. McG8]MYW53271.1 DUF899 domain-containing protein [Streptomyces sp. SID8376]WSB53749.1 DUF899 domain-containing protein [Streptomyces cellulosae]WTB68771.1 DUF899 domain-containing protein [Streptomyces cellulosae]WTC19311.1 DUF899 domain-containing protein [Streptomyces cellulosae]